MKLINSSYEILPYESDYNKAIELAGRTAYQSQDKITNDSAPKFVRMLENNRHGAALEHGTIYLRLSIGSPAFDLDYIENMDVMLFYKSNPYSVVNEEIDSHGFVKTYYITTNYRVIFENNRQYDLKFKCEPTKFHEKRVSVKLIVSRAIQNELVRHRSMSFLVESTRFCNYSKDKFNNQLTFIIPNKLNISEMELSYNDAALVGSQCATPMEMVMITRLANIESDYKYLLSCNYSPQDARDILPLCLKTEMIMTGTIKDWKQVFKLRTAEDAHPDVRKLMIPLQKEIESLYGN